MYETYYRPYSTYGTQPQQPEQQNKLAGLAGNIGGKVAGKYAASQLIGLLGNGSTVASTVPSIAGLGAAPGIGATAAVDAAIAGSAGTSGGILSSLPTLASAAPYAAIPAAAYVGYHGLKGLDTIKDGGEFSTGEKIAYALPTFGASLFVDPADLWGSGKGKDQQERDGLRDALEKIGFASKNDRGSHEITLADGSKFDIGRDLGTNDGVTMTRADFDNQDFSFLAPEEQELLKRRIYEGADAGRSYEAFEMTPDVMANNGDTVSAASALIAALEGDQNKNLINSFGGYLTNAALSSGDADANLKHFATQMGLTDKDAMIAAIGADNSLSQWEKLAKQNAINQLYGDDGSGSYKANSEIDPAHQAAYDEYRAGLLG